MQSFYYKFTLFSYLFLPVIDFFDLVIIIQQKRRGFFLRTITFSESMRIFSSNISIRFGTTFFLLGMIFVLVFVGSIAYRAPLLLIGNDDTKGTIIDVGGTNGEINDEDTYLYKYTYKVDDQTYIDEIISTSTYDVGDKLKISYSMHFPAISVPLNDIEFSSFFTLIFPIIGLIFIRTGVRGSRENLYLIKHGRITEGVFVEKKSTGTKINKQRVYEYVFEVRNSYGEKQYVSHESISTRRLEDDAKEILLYDEERNICIPIDVLPNDLRTRIKTEF